VVNRVLVVGVAQQNRADQRHDPRRVDVVGDLFIYDSQT
jgi:hypothetical protein